MDNPTIPTDKKQLMLDALEKSLGVVTTAAKSVGINRSTHYEWLKTDADYNIKVKEIENIAIDFAESQLHKQIQDGNTTATIFFLKCKAKNRGYTEKIEIGVDDGTSIRLEILDGNTPNK